MEFSDIDLQDLAWSLVQDRAVLDICDISEYSTFLETDLALIYTTLSLPVFEELPPQHGEIFSLIFQMRPGTRHGRDHCILIYAVTTAATHALLRRELFCLVQGNGTISSRLCQYHSDFTAIIHSGVLPSTTTGRSVAILHKLCVQTLKQCIHILIIPCFNARNVYLRFCVLMG